MIRPLAWLRRRPNVDRDELIAQADTCIRAIADAVDGYGTETERLALIAQIATRWELIRDGVTAPVQSTLDSYREAV